MIDLGFKVNKFVCSNYRNRGDLIMEKLDRVITNYEWIKLYPNVVATHLPHLVSDRSPLLLKLNSDRGVNYQCPFRLESFW